jgi:hypothetical protein
MKNRIIVAAAAAVTFAAPLAAQTAKAQGIPPGHMPPAGMCRIWIRGVPAGRQPAPTDCVSAERNRPANATVIYSGTSDGDVWRRGLVVSRERDALGRLIFRDASGRIVTRERTNDGYLIWRDANGTVLRREAIGTRRLDDDKLSKAEKERLKAVRKAEKERLKAIRKANGDNRVDDDDDDDDDNRGKAKGKNKGKGKPGRS